MEVIYKWLSSYSFEIPIPDFKFKFEIKSDLWSMGLILNMFYSNRKNSNFSRISWLQLAVKRGLFSSSPSEFNLKSVLNELVKDIQPDYVGEYNFFGQSLFPIKNLIHLNNKLRKFKCLF